ncbi:MAG: mechanosensitive ion channel [Gemmatimonadetes bacterium]|nr:mechanosensitive ion channel [Gemmatimonadota bacterium]
MEWIRDWMTGRGMQDGTAELAAYVIIAFAILVLAWISWFVAKRVVLRVLKRVVARSQVEWDDVILENQVFARLAELAPAFVLYFTTPVAFAQHANVVTVVERLAVAYMILVLIRVISGLLDSAHAIYTRSEAGRSRPIRGYVQIAKIVTFFVLGVLALAVLMNRSPFVFLSGMGALTAVILLVFKDTILGFVASIQLSANDMVKVGDWIEMPKYGADGTVTDATLTAVKVQNWDKTISTIPTYALVSDAFRNWKGMEESGGRRIKRAINIDMTSVRFLTTEDVDRFRKFAFLTKYIETKVAEVQKYNDEIKVDLAVLVNGRRLTNIGTFRAYLQQYLRKHPLVNPEMTFLVRQLAPGPQGIPIEIYVFSKVQAWADYEQIQADIFDHILAVIPEFGLRVFQDPTGGDFRQIPLRASEASKS